MQENRKERFKFSKLLALTLVLAMSLSLPLAGCTDNKKEEEKKEEESGTDDGFSGVINVVTREDGSGTRSAFVELFEVQEVTADGKKVDAITVDAVTTNSTAVMLTTVSGDDRAIGFISMGSLNDTVKALDIDGVAATTTNAASGAYPIIRPFNIITTGDVSDEAQDFINFIMSKEGQNIIVANHCIAVDPNAPAYVCNGASGKIVIGGSSSVG
ncbi:MAG: substrate-binding domain-containing protein, partial [Coriobacteriia bacterium]|nr:substrate-binding domain-containing protein [Coriobacteriia bacterium]